MKTQVEETPILVYYYSARIDPVNGFSFDPATRVIIGTPTSIGVSSGV